jgi:hypothetical protein
MQLGGPFYLLGNGGPSQNRGNDVVGALDYGRDNPAARDCPGSGDLRGGAAWACGVFGKMPRQRQGMRQSLYFATSNQGRRVERCHARLHSELSDPKCGQRGDIWLLVGLPWSIGPIAPFFLR